jgi:hypothetical protein
MIPDFRRGLAQRYYFGVSRRVRIGDGAISGARGDLALYYDYRSHRHFATLGRKTSLLERGFHECWIVRAVQYHSIIREEKLPHREDSTAPRARHSRHSYAKANFVPVTASV